MLGTLNSSSHFTCPCRASDKDLIFPHVFALISGTEYLNQADRVEPLFLGTGNIFPAIGTIFFLGVLFFLDLSHHLEWVLNLVLSGCTVLL